MLFAIGTRIVLKHTGLAGKVSDHLAGGMIEVTLDDGDNIPVFVEDVIREDEFKVLQQHNKPAKESTNKAQIYAGSFEKPSTQSLGIQLAFDPMYNAEGDVREYRMLLLNDTSSDIIFTCSLRVNNSLKSRVNNKLSALSYQQVGTLTFDQLNDNPEIELNCWEMMTTGSGYQINKSIKIKAKQFFKKISDQTPLNRPVHLYILIDKLSRHDKTAEDLRTYTLKNSKPTINHSPADLHEVKALANFSGELDLHIEKLVSDARKLSNIEILRIQLRHFEDYLDKADSLGVDRVFIIHGLGKGKLRDSIASRLINDHRVATFRNEYHPRFGYGATEVIFR